jgi:hypothetical protein
MEAIIKSKYKTGVSPLVGLMTGNFTVRQVALKAASRKMLKEKKTCCDN